MLVPGKADYFCACKARDAVLDALNMARLLPEGTGAYERARSLLIQHLQEALLQVPDLLPVKGTTT